MWIKSTLSGFSFMDGVFSVVTKTSLPSPRSPRFSPMLLSRTAVPNLFGTKDRFRGRRFFHRRGGGDSGGDARDGERL